MNSLVMMTDEENDIIKDSIEFGNVNRNEINCASNPKGQDVASFVINDVWREEVWSSDMARQFVHVSCTHLQKGTVPYALFPAFFEGSTSQKLANLLTPKHEISVNEIESS